MTFTLPQKLPQYLVRLHVSYDRKGEEDLRDVIASCRYYVREATRHDNWNGGMWGHDVVLFLPLLELAKVDVEEQGSIAEGIKGLLNKMAESISDEWFDGVYFELADDNDRECQQARPFSQTPPINPDAVEFWKPGMARVFISHRDAHKKEARELSDALEEYGMSCFVAHDTIQPLSEWRSEIMKGLQTMEVMLVFLTDDFAESMWCQQEVGYALGKDVPIISLKLGKFDPPGFISHVQAQRGSISAPIKSAETLFPLIAKVLRQEDRSQEIIVTSFCSSPSFSDTKVRFERMDAQVKKLTAAQVEQIIASFRTNDQLHNAGVLTSKFQRLRKFLERTTGDEFTQAGREIKKVVPHVELDENVPF